jgi:hypothetical protein
MVEQVCFCVLLIFIALEIFLLHLVIGLKSVWC